MWLGAGERVRVPLRNTARRLTDSRGIPAYGNVSINWDLPDPEHPNPENR